MPHVFVWPAAAFVAGIACGLMLLVPPVPAALTMLGALAAAVCAFARQQTRAVFVFVLAGWVAAGIALGSRAERNARAPELAEAALATAPAQNRDLASIHGHRAPRNELVTLVGRLRSDASVSATGVGLTIDVEQVERSPRVVRASGGAMLTVVGTLAADRASEWRSGRRVRVRATVREPARYLNPGVPDMRLALARRGTVLAGTVKSGALVEVVARGPWVRERAAAARQHVRRLVAASVGSWDAGTAGIVTAILVGDRAGLDERTERDLQDAGTYHVIAISGGNIAILAACLLAACRLVLMPWRAGLVAVVAALVAYAEVAGGGSSVVRATTMAVTYLAARLVDQRTSVGSALTIAAAVILASSPLALLDAGFLLTFGATMAIVIGVPRVVASVGGPRLLRPAVGLFAASAAAEVALLPLGPLFFSRLTLAGLVFNFAAVPLMSVVQIGGMAAVAVAAVSPSLAHWAGWVPHEAARALVASAALVHLVPWASWRVPSPAPWLLAAYYGALVALVTSGAWVRFTVPWHRAARRAVVLTWALAAVLIAAGPLPAPSDPRLRVTVLDVGQGDATVIQLPSGRAVLVDAGGLGGTARFDVGERVVAPALWQLGVRRLEVLALTHGDADHVGGAAAIVEAFRPREIWEGVPVPADPALSSLAALADTRHIAWRRVQAGDLLRDGAVTIRVWHPPPPDWERQRVRNDDSLVLEVRYGDVSLVLPGDIGTAIEGALLAQISDVPIRILKAAHHGSASSSSKAFLGALRPQTVIVSCGRGNLFGHPHPAVLARYRASGAQIYRTDEQGAITIETDGQTVQVTPF
ncbi:MAG TPA: DNA internalization-related competence protein ComEC/Rec2, partial [Vicinamibacterales bacterium]|nr:DNA internalization-related competence protein ComEC/Rec2 [Vicinamibacterales bacterium]